MNEYMNECMNECSRASPRREAHLQIPDFVRDVLLRHAAFPAELGLLGDEDAVVRESSRSHWIQLPATRRKQVAAA